MFSSSDWFAATVRSVIKHNDFETSKFYTDMTFRETSKYQFFL